MINARTGKPISVRELRRLPNLYKVEGAFLYPLLATGTPDYFVSFRNRRYQPRVWKLGQIHLLDVSGQAFNDAPGHNLKKHIAFSEFEDLIEKAANAYFTSSYIQYVQQCQPELLKELETILNEHLRKEVSNR